MLKFAIVFFVVALISSLFAFGFGSSEFAKILFVLFSILTIASFLLDLFKHEKE